MVAYDARAHRVIFDGGAGELRFKGGWEIA